MNIHKWRVKTALPEGRNKLEPHIRKFIIDHWLRGNSLTDNGSWEDTFRAWGVDMKQAEEVILSAVEGYRTKLKSKVKRL